MIQRMNHLEATKSRKPAIKSDPIASSLDRKSRMICIRDQITTCFRLAAQIHKHSPVLLSRSKYPNPVDGPEGFDKIERYGKGCGFPKYLGMSDDPKTSAQNQFRHSYPCWFLQCCKEPLLDLRVPPAFFTMGLHQDIDVEKSHHSDSITSRRDAEEFKSTPS